MFKSTSERELMYIQDSLALNELMIQKFRVYHDHAKDPDLAKLFEHQSNIHEEQYNLLLQQLHGSREVQ